MAVGDEAGKKAAEMIVAAMKADVLPEVAKLRAEVGQCRELLEKLLNKRAVITAELVDK